MVFRLSEQYALRGWEKLPCVLLDRRGGRASSLTKIQFRVLALCDGHTELDPSWLSAGEREALDGFLKEQVVSASDAPEAITPEQEYRRYANRQVSRVHWSVTGRCNYRCRHCYMDAPDAAMGELSHEEAMNIIDQMAQCGIYRVSLTGGEPFVRPDFWELVDALLARGIVISQVYTNGWLVDEKLLSRFEARKMKPEFMFSFDGVGWHDWMRGIKGAEEAALRAMRLCVERGFLVGAEMCVHRGNASTLRDTVNTLAGIGVPSLTLGTVSNTELWRKNSEGNEYSYEECYGLAEEYIPQFFEDGCPMYVVISGIVELLPKAPWCRVITDRAPVDGDPKACYLCGSARSSAYITPDGRLLPCIAMTSAPQKFQEQFPKIADIGLQKGLSDSVYMEFIDRRLSDFTEANPKCADCSHLMQCQGGCRAHALEVTGDPMGAPENLCAIWDAGYVDRIRKTAQEAVARYCPGEVPNESTAG